VNHLIATYGYFAVALFVGAESLGVPLPGETSLILAAIYAGHTHRLSVWVIFVVAATAAIVGDNIGFWIGDRGGYRLLRRYGHYVRFDESKVKVGRYIFDRHGGKVVFFGRFVSVLRTYAAFLAGTNRMRWRRFLLYNAAGGIVWAAIYTFVAYVAGNTLRQVSGTINLALGAAAVVAICIALLLVRRQMGRLTALAEDTYPGPLEDQARSGPSR
jgi:membrane protein DedA with SNARE-associated domain